MGGFFVFAILAVFGVWALPALVQAQSSSELVSWAPATCSGWEGADRARTIDLAAGASQKQFTAANSASFIYQPAQIGSFGAITVDDTLHCESFSGKKLVRGMAVTGADVVVSLGALAGEDSAGVVVPEYSTDSGANWTALTTILIRDSLDNRTNGGYWKSALPTGLGASDFAKFHVRLRVSADGEFTPSTVLVDGVRLDLHVAKQAGQELARFFSTTETPVVIIDQKSLDGLQLLDANGRVVNAPLQTAVVSDGVRVTFKPGYRVAPGTYVLRSTKHGLLNTTVTEQTFSYGIASINTPKSVYQPGDVVPVAMGVVNDAGKTVCNASLSLAVTKPDGTTQRLTTADHAIARSSACGPESLTNAPDYTAHFVADQTGAYTLTLNNATSKGTKSVVTQLTVAPAGGDVFERQAPTRINPKAEYVNVIRVTPAADYTGTFTEPLSDGVAASQLSADGEVVTRDGHDVVEWQVSWKAGTTYEYRYTFDAPDVSPALATFGPASFGSVVEPRTWAVSVDESVRAEKAGLAYESVPVTSADWQAKRTRLVEATKSAFTRDENAQLRVYKTGYQVDPTSIDLAFRPDAKVTVQGVSVLSPSHDSEITAYQVSEEFRRGTKTMEELHLVPGPQFQPGVYTIRTTYSDGTTTVMKETAFAWGVIAFNTERATYHPGETARLEFGTVDAVGKTVCDAALTATITAPDGQVTVLGTDQGTITPSSTCGPTTVTNEPDYEAVFGVSGLGDYRIDVTATTAAGTHTMTDTILVRDTIPFEITRLAPTRLFPGANYTVTLRVHANEDYQGDVTESVPASYGIVAVGQNGKAASPSGDRTGIHWKVNWQAGELHDLTYVMDPADISPALFLLGPAAVGAYTEPRQWQIASDAIITISGNLYSDEGTTPIDCSAANKTVTLKVNGLGVYSDTCTASTGAYSIANVIAVSSDIITVYIDGAAEKAVHVLKSNATSQSNVHLYQNRVIARADTGSISNANLGQYDSDNDADIQFSSNASALVVASGSELHVWTGSTYLPGGTITTDATGGNFHIDDNATATNDTATSTIGGNIVIDAGATMNNSQTLIVTGGGITTAGTGAFANSGTPLVTLNGSGTIGGGSGSITFGNLTISGGTTTVSSDVSIANTLTVDVTRIFSIDASKTVSLTSTGGTTLTLNGTISGAGRLAYLNQVTDFPTTGTMSAIIRFDVSTGSMYIPARPFGGNVEVYTNSSTSARFNYTRAGTITISGGLYMMATDSQNLTLDVSINNSNMVIAGDIDFTGVTAGTEILIAGTGTWTVSGNIDFTDGTFTCRSSTFVMDGAGKTIITAGHDIYNLTESGTTTLSGSANITHSLAVNDGQTLTIASGTTLTMTSTLGSMLVLNTTGTVAGAGRLSIKDSSGNSFTTTGTISSILRLDVSGGTNSFPVRTYAGPVECYSNTSVARTCRIGTGSPQTVTFGSDVTVIADGTAGPIINASTWNNITNVTGNLSCIKNSSGTPSIVTAFSSWTSSGSVDLTNCSFTASAGNTFTMNGTGGKTLIGASATFINLTIDPSSTDTITVNTSGLTVTTTLAVAATDTLSISSGVTVTASTTVTLTGTISGAGRLTYASATTFPTGGTMSSILRFDGTAASRVVPARTYGGLVEAYNNSTSARNFTLGTAGSQTLTLNGGLMVYADNSADANIIGSTWNPIMNITGNISYAGVGAANETITTGSSTWTVAGTIDFSNGTFTSSNNEVVMSGTGNLIGNGQSFYNLTINGSGNTVTVTTSDVTVTNILKIGGTTDGNDDTLSIASSRSVTSGTAGTVTIVDSGTDSITGTGTLTVQNSNLSANGTLSSPVTFDATSGAITMPARTYGGAVVITDTGASDRTVTAGAGTLTFSSTLTLTHTSTGRTTLELNTNDPTTTITGALTIGANDTFSANSANALNINGNYTNNGTFTHNSGTVTLAGAAQQTLSGTMTTTSAFNALTITNSSGADPDSSPSVIFGAGASGSTLTVATASVKLRFAAGATYTFTNISFNGQAAGTRVTLRSSTPGTQWTLASSGTHAVSYTDVKDSIATTPIDASNGTNIDSGNNETGWTFGQLSVALSANTLSLGSLSAATITKASLTSTVTISGSNGFLSYILEDHPLRIDGSHAIADESGGGTIVAGTPEFGVSTDEPSGVDVTATSPACSTGVSTSNATALATTGKTFATASGNVTGDVTTLCFLTSINATTTAGSYGNIITIVTVGKY